MTIDHLVWDDWNREHIARHNVTPEEVEQVILGTCKALFKRLMAVFSAVIRVATITRE
jgi:hypothetical protein